MNYRRFLFFNLIMNRGKEKIAEGTTYILLAFMQMSVVMLLAYKYGSMRFKMVKSFYCKYREKTGDERHRNQ